MIKHILKIMWNQRRSNGWIFAELLVVAAVLWMMVDTFWVDYRTYHAPLGFDIGNVWRFKLSNLDDIGGGKMIRGFVPLSEMFGYATDLRSRTQGRGNYSMFFEKYEQVPKSVQEKILSKKD